MTSPTEEDIKAFNNDVETFLSRLSREKKEIQDDLKGINPPLLSGKICDFGCGDGYTTYCLTTILNATESIGIDSDPVAINQAEVWFKAVKLYKQIAAKEELSDSALSQEANKILGIVRPPEFIVGDVISGQNLPKDIRLAYCRRLLVNIVYGNYGDNLSGIDRVKLAIKNIVNTIIPGGWFVAVEESSGGNFSQSLEEIGLKQIQVMQFNLDGIVPYTRYVYRKLV